MGYDPARSFGNPLYEGLLVLLQPQQAWWISNLFNLLLSVSFLFRLSRYFPELTIFQTLIFRLVLMSFLFFQEMACSSMESMMGLLVFFECLQAQKQENLLLFFGLFVSAIFIRPEYFLLLSLAGQNLFFNENKSILFWLIVLAFFSLYLGWAWGKNTLPFQSISTATSFYLGRIFYLIRQAGLFLPLWLLPFFLLFWRKSYSHIPKWTLANLFLFLLFPFEWAYLWPAMIYSLGLFLGRIPASKKMLSIPFFLWPMAWIELPGTQNCFPFWQVRKSQLALLAWADSVQPSRPTLLLDGATFVPYRVKNWSKTLDNKVFQKENSKLFIGELLGTEQLDSFRQAGFQIFRHREDVFENRILKP